MEDLPKLITDMSRDELEEHCVAIQIECEDLEEQNAKLTSMAQEVVELAKKNGEMAENYQSMFRELFDLIVDKYDADFKIEDIPKRFS